MKSWAGHRSGLRGWFGWACAAVAVLGAGIWMVRVGPAQNPPAAVGGAAETGKPEVFVQQVSVSHGDRLAKAWARFRNDRHFGSSDEAAMKVTLRIHAPSDELVAAAVVLENASDDTGKSLLANSNVGEPDMLWTELTNVSKNRHDAFVQAAFADTPAKGATEVTLRGTVKLRVGKGRKSLTVQVPMLPHSTFGPADLLFEIQSISAYDPQDVDLTVAGPAGIERLCNLVFSDGKGNLLTQGPPRIEAAMRRESPELDYSLTGSPDSMQVDMTWYDKVEAVNVPFVLKVGIGL